MLALANYPAVQFWKTVYEIMAFVLDTVIHREVDDFHIFGDVVAFYEFLGVTVCCTEEYDVDCIER